MHRLRRRGKCENTHANGQDRTTNNVTQSRDFHSSSSNRLYYIDLKQNVVALIATMTWEPPLHTDVVILSLSDEDAPTITTSAASTGRFWGCVSITHFFLVTPFKPRAHSYHIDAFPVLDLALVLFFILFERSDHLNQGISIVLPNSMRGAALDGSEKKIYLLMDAGARYGDVKTLLPEIQLTGIEKAFFINETARTVLR